MTVAHAIHGRLNKAGYTVTYPRQVILHVLGQQTEWFAADELVRAVARANPPVGRATVFRLLALLEALGLVERVHVHDCSRFLACTETAHHHYLICVACGKVSTVLGCGLEEWIPTAADVGGFQAEGHVVQIFGRYRRCRPHPAGG
jgi:Fur family transcriptional regulator, ferric uptake regulator